MKITVLGSGSFATAMATVLARNKHSVVMLTRSEEAEHSINQRHVNPFYLSDFELPANLTATTSNEVAFKDTELIIHSIPVQASKQYLADRRQFIPGNVPIVSTSKGIHTDSLEMMNDIIASALSPSQPMAFFSGPSFAKELMNNVPSAVVVAASDEAVANIVKTAYASERLRVYVSDDVVGVEVGGALKNVYAIAAGVLDGMNLGQNTTAALVTRGCSEMNRLAIKMGANPHTLAGLSGMGDLILTCMGSLSRNKTVGIRLGKGETLENIRATMKEVAEGVATTPAVIKLAAKLEVDMPICQGVAWLLSGEKNATEVLKYLMTLPSDRETYTY